MKSISAVINARLESSRVPRKLVRPFAGTTLLEIALAKLDRMNFCEKRYLGAADAELKSLASRYESVEILEREGAAVKRGVNPPEVTFAHYLQVPSDYILVFNPCLPFLTVETVRRAVEYFHGTEFPSYTSAVPTREWIFDAEGNALTNSDPRNVTTNIGRVFYKAAHAFHIVNKRFFETYGYFWRFVRHDPHLIEIPEEEAVDVDSELEFAFAEFRYIKRLEASGGQGGAV
jgi:CMP-N-acetylneuraminic acid synthetase